MNDIDEEDWFRATLTLFLAGQIASCIHHGIWKKEYISYDRESRFFPDGRDDKTTLAVWTDASHAGFPAKILQTFAFDLGKEGHFSTEEEKLQAEQLHYIKNLPRD